MTQPWGRKVALVIRSDRGDAFLPDCLVNLGVMWPEHPDPIIVDDRHHTFGLAGAVAEGWRLALEHDADYLLEWEEDFLAIAPLPVAQMLAVLEQEPRLAQVVLKRQAAPHTPEEAAGGIIECDPDAYNERAVLKQQLRWTEHRKIFSLNPCLIPRRVLELGWPTRSDEGEFTKVCLDAGYRFAFYGRKFDPPRVTHVGTFRSAGWRL